MIRPFRKSLYSLSDDNQPVQVGDGDEAFLRWCRERPIRRVAYDSTESGFDVSTVFMGIDARIRISPDDDDPPILWETAVFRTGENDDQPLDRQLYMSHAEAVAGHASWLAKYRSRSA